MGGRSRALAPSLLAPSLLAPSLLALALLVTTAACGPAETSTETGAGANGGSGGAGAAGGSGGSGGAGGGDVCGPFQIPVTDPAACNGSPALCERRFDEVSYPTTHNAMSNADEGWIAPNQTHPLRVQLTDGVRGLMLDTHENADGVPSLCHGACAWGETPLVTALHEIATFLRCNPREVVTLIFEAYITPEQTDAAFVESGLVDFVHTQHPGDPWPTLAEMIAGDHRLVALTDDPAGSPAYYHHVWDLAWDNPYAAETPEDLSCELGRGDPANSLFILNHFLTAPTGDPALAEQINHNPFFLTRAQTCAAETGDHPNFVTVDFHDIGDLFEVTATLDEL